MGDEAPTDGSFTLSRYSRAVKAGEEQGRKLPVKALLVQLTFWRRTLQKEVSLYFNAANALPTASIVYSMSSFVCSVVKNHASYLDGAKLIPS